MTDSKKPLLSRESIEALARIATSTDDVQAIFASVGIPFRYRRVDQGSGFVYFPGPRDHALESLEALDLTGRDQVSRVLRAIPQMVELFQAGKDADGRKLIRLRRAVETDGFHIGPTGDFIAAFNDLATSAGTALADISGIRAELHRLEKSIPDDPAAAIGRAKNLVEATAKAILAYRGQAVGGDDKLQALAARAMEELGVHPRQESSEREQVRRLLGRLQGMMQDLAELRNDVGDGHGAATAPAGLESRHGRLAVWAALGWCAFMLDTHSAGSNVQTESLDATR